MNEFLSYIIETLLFLGLLVSTYFYLQQVLNLNELLISKMLTLCISYSVSFNLQKFIAQKIISRKFSPLFFEFKEKK